MKTVSFIAVLALLPLLVSACFHENPPPPQSMPEVTNQTRQAVSREMVRKAEEFGLSIQKESLLYVSRGDLTVASAVVSDFDTLAPSGPNRTATLGLAYIVLPEEARIKQVTGTRTTLPRQFYAVQIRSLNNEAHFINRSNRSGAALQLQRAKTQAGPRPQIEVNTCTAILRFVQVPQSRDDPAIQADILLDWCEEEF